MNKKKYAGMFFIGVLCSVIIATQPLYAEVSQMAVDEVEQTIPCEELKNNDNQSQIDLSQPEPAEQRECSDNPEGAEEQISDENEEIPVKEEPATEKKTIKKTVSDETVKIDKTTKEKKPWYVVISEYINGLKNSLMYRVKLVKNSLEGYIFAKTNFKPEEKKVLSTRDFAPYYFINDISKNNYLELLAFPEKIRSVRDLMPYGTAIQNTEIKLKAQKNLVTPQGVTNTFVLMNAPSPQIEVKGENLFAKLVIDIKNNTLYKYDKEGFPLKAYLVATGAYGTRTMAGLRIVTYKEKFPYSGAPNSKRALDPYSYGPYIIFLNAVNSKTGRQYAVEQLLHGNGNEYSIGRKVSHGCVRTNNNVMRKELSKEVKRGDYILLINPD